MTGNHDEVVLGSLYVKFRVAADPAALRHIANLSFSQLRTSAHRHLREFRPEIRVTVERGSIVARGGAYTSRLRVRERIIVAGSIEPRVAEIANRADEFARQARRGIVERATGYRVERSRVNPGLPARLLQTFTSSRNGHLSPKKALTRILDELGVTDNQDRLFQRRLAAELENNATSSDAETARGLTSFTDIPPEARAVLSEGGIRAVRSKEFPSAKQRQESLKKSLPVQEVRGYRAVQDAQGNVTWDIIY